MVARAAEQGFLTRHDIALMMKEMGYAADEDYLSQVVDLFKSFDADDDGIVEFNEFKLLWEHLGGEDALQASSDPQARKARNEHDEQDPLWRTFCRSATQRLTRLTP